jgi:rare lipoprotein A
MRRVLILLALVSFSFDASASTFDDVDVTHPHYNAIETLADLDIVEGYKTDSGVFFKSSNKVTRVAALKMLLLAANIDVEMPEDGLPYSDVDAQAWYAGYLHVASEFGIVEGFEDGTFRPEQNVTQAEYLAMLSRAFGKSIEEYTEVDDAWFDGYVRFGRFFNLIDSTEPNEALTRGKLAEMTFRMRKVNEKKYEEEYVYFGSGTASYYHPSLAGNPTATGAPYDPQAMTAAHRTLPFGTKVRVTNEAGTSIVVTVNDRGPYHDSRVLDLSEKAFNMLAAPSAGLVEVEYEIVGEEVAEVIPDEILGALDEDTKLIPVPFEIVQTLTTEVEIDEKKKTVNSLTY